MSSPLVRETDNEVVGAYNLSRVRSAAYLLGVAAVCVFAALPSVAQAETRWIRARTAATEKGGAFESISDANGNEARKSATQALSQFLQFSFALGSAMGQPDLRLDPPLRILVFRNAQDLETNCFPGVRMGRDRLMACTTSEGQLPRSLLRELTRTLLQNNFANLPGPLENALETFFSTVESNAVHVTWGAPPPPAERTREWALLHRILTQPDDSGKAKIYLHNLAKGMDLNAASRNAFGEEAKTFEAEIDRYSTAGKFPSAVAPNRPINPDRDFNTTVLTSDDGELMRADLLTAASPGLYQGLLSAGKHVAEANEGLALLAIRSGDMVGARGYIAAARSAGTKNFVALTAFARLEKDPEQAVELLKQALTLDPKYAEAHWVFGEKLADPGRRMMEWKQAANLAPRNYQWWVEYAQLCVNLQQYAEAGRAWVAAAQAAPDPALREQYLNARGQIETQRLAAEDEERRQSNAAKAAEIDRLKAEARKELADLEVRTNTRPLSAAEAAKTVAWMDDEAATLVTGTLMKVECMGTAALPKIGGGQQVRLSVRDDAGKTRIFLVRDTSEFEIKGADSLACGPQKPRKVAVSLKAGEPASLEFSR